MHPEKTREGSAAWILTVENATFLSWDVAGQNVSENEQCTGMYLNPARTWLEDRHHSGARVALSIEFWRALQTPVVAR